MSQGSDWGAAGNSPQASPNPFGGGPGGSNLPPGPLDPSHQPPSGSPVRIVLLVLGIVVGLFALGALACCGVGYFGVQMFQSELGKQYRQQIEDSPEIAQHIGQIESLEMRFIDSAVSDDEDEMIFDIRGSKGSGRVFIDMRLADSADPDGAFVLVLDDGTRVPLTGVKEAPSDFDFDFEMDLDTGAPVDEAPDAQDRGETPEIDLGDPAQHRREIRHSFASLIP